MDIALALGGGGVKGLAHIGVLQVLEREGFNIRAIAGTSAGGMVGAIYSAGYAPDEIASRLVMLDFKRMYSRMPGDRPSLLGLSGVTHQLADFLGSQTFADLKLPFACTAVDLEAGELVTLSHGQVLEAVLATIAVPGIFPPRLWEGRLMVDGGVLDPVPVALARSLAPHLPVVAVVLSPALRDWSRGKQPPRLLHSLPFMNRIYQTRLAQSFNIFLRSVDIAGCMLTDLRLQVDQPEVIIRPIVEQIGFMDNIDVNEVIGMGAAAAENALPRLKTAAGWRGTLSSRLPWLSDFLKVSDES